MSPRARNLLIGLMLLGGVAALVDALRARQELPLEIVELQVAGLRNTLLVLEDKVGQAPQACGDEETARAALEQSPPEEKGACGEAYFGRQAQGPGAYWVALEPGGGFTVHGLAQVRGQTWHVTATRESPPHRSPE
ncbi:MAG: hypothetical protein H6740_24600 [Alphaproteobacteria bacterium]|nr:hypothetical protein [Alphaproteobacteria bacterium]